MSNNQKYQDNIEQSCLEFVKRNLKEKDSFGLSNKQYIELENWLNNSKLNSNNRFPDFTFNNGFIEHFAVTSSLEDKKGAKQKRKSIIFSKRSESNFLSELDNSEVQKVIIGRSYGRKFEEHAYDHIVDSIKKNWVKHIESYDKNITTSKNGIFLIEYMDINIQTAVSRKNESVKVFDTYRISVDKHMLDWIHNYKEKIDYLILVNLLSPSIEVIRIDRIPKIIEGILDVWYAPIIGVESHKYIGIKTNNTDT